MADLDFERRHYLARCHSARLLGQSLPELPAVLREAGDKPQQDDRIKPQPAALGCTCGGAGGRPLMHPICETCRKHLEAFGRMSARLHAGG